MPAPGQKMQSFSLSIPCGSSTGARVKEKEDRQTDRQTERKKDRKKKKKREEESGLNGEISKETDKSSFAFKRCIFSTLKVETSFLCCPIQGHIVKVFYRGKQ